MRLQEKMELSHSSSWISLMTWDMTFFVTRRRSSWQPASSKSRRSSHLCLRGFPRLFCVMLSGINLGCGGGPPTGTRPRKLGGERNDSFCLRDQSLSSRYAAHTLTKSQRRSIASASLEFLLPIPTSSSARRHHTEDILNPCDFLRTFFHKGILT